ncbi:MAG TPA: hypothetical protein VMJ93_16130 [Verrucomicrobiae bacterium]|nr:hypothetical protein [Verrucomicrobiae bacterium]
MAHSIWDTPGDPERRWGKRKGPPLGIPGWAGLVIIVLGLSLAGTIAWRGGLYMWHWANGMPSNASDGLGHDAAARFTLGHRPAAVRNIVPEWQIDTQAAFQAGVTDASAGNIESAEMDVDRGAEILQDARAQQLTPPPDFFDLAIRTLDLVIQSHPDNDRLLEHTALARIELAQMRTMLPQASPGAPGFSLAGPAGLAGAAAMGEKTADEVPGQAAGKKPAGKAVQVLTPISVAANTTYDPVKAGGNVLDATSMADDAEVLLPPASRLFTDSVRVRNLTIQGASQTLDGVYWENVTFIGTRLRYEGGEVSLHNVKFVNCTFGMEPNNVGARLATAIALGQTSFFIE